MATTKTRCAPLPGPLYPFKNGEVVTDTAITNLKNFIKRMERKLVCEKGFRMSYNKNPRVIESMRCSGKRAEPLDEEKQKIFDSIKDYTAFVWELYDIISKYKIEYITEAIKLLELDEIAPCDFNDDLVLAIRRTRDLTEGSARVEELAQHEKRALEKWRMEKEREFSMARSG